MILLINKAKIEIIIRLSLTSVMKIRSKCRIQESVRREDQKCWKAAEI
jgi:hypothetical protein